jgi:hypothetical protein
VIAEKLDQAASRKKGFRGGRPVRHDAALHKERSTVEPLIDKLKAWREAWPPGTTRPTLDRSPFMPYGRAYGRVMTSIL